METRPYDFMVKLTPQKDWIAGHGVLIAFAFFLGGLSGGVYLAALYFDNLVGMFVGWGLALLMGVIDMAHLSQPKKFWRMLLRPNTSWISRGFIIITLFIGAAAIQLALSTWLPGTAAEIAFKALAGLLAFAVAIYSGFVVGSIGAIKLWNSAIIPVLFIATGLVGGLAVLLAITTGSSQAEMMVSAASGSVPYAWYAGSSQYSVLVFAMRAILVIYAIFVVVYLWISASGGPGARDSALMMVRGSLAPVFWLGVVLTGIVAPMALLFAVSSSDGAPAALPVSAAVCVIAGTGALRYSILKAGMYTPLIPANKP
jgi:formate-dependent nitrite reductase membrane component NrfD